MRNSSCTTTSQECWGWRRAIIFEFGPWGLALGMVAVICTPGKLSWCDHNTATPVSRVALRRTRCSPILFFIIICGVLPVVMSSRAVRKVLFPVRPVPGKEQGESLMKTEMTQIHGISRGGPRAEPSLGILSPGPYLYAKAWLGQIYDHLMVF